MYAKWMLGTHWLDIDGVLKIEVQKKYANIIVFGTDIFM